LTATQFEAVEGAAPGQQSELPTQEIAEQVAQGPEGRDMLLHGAQRGISKAYSPAQQDIEIDAQI